MSGDGDEPPRRPALLVAGVAACLVASEFAGVGVPPAFAAGATGGVVDILHDIGTMLINEAVEFLVGVVVAAVVLGLIRIVVSRVKE